jgi:nitrile hydratase accessory protein
MTRDQALRLPGLPRDADGPVFDAPWQAQAFALVLALHERGAFGWTTWTQALSEAIRAAQERGDPDDGSTYWQHWLEALQAMVLSRGLGSAAELHALEHAWEAAAERTPHGQPIELSHHERGPARG